MHGGHNESNLRQQAFGKRFPRFGAGWRKAITAGLALIALAVFMATAFRAGWNRAETDFPNYYTAAVLVRKRAPLHNYYQWTWFQRRMNYAGVENQLGGYIPQTPLTMLPVVPVASFQVQAAKRIWLLLNLVFLGLAVWLLSRITRFSVAELSLLAFAGYGTLYSNFLLGQYYVFLLLLLVFGFYCLNRGKESWGGVLFGAAFALKLYGGPFALYFVVRRRWGALTGMILAFGAAVAIAVLIFGWNEILYFATQILPRSLEGQTLDPYNSWNGTISTFLRRSFVMEPELNPHPLWNAPGLFFFLQPFITVLILVFPFLGLRESITEKRRFAWFYIALVLASPNTASYTFVLLLLPVALLLDETRWREGILLISCYVLLILPLLPASSSFFPRVWLLLVLFVYAGYRSKWLTNARQVVGTIALAAAVAIPFAWRRENAYLQEPGRHWERIAVQRGAIYSSSPAVLRSGIVYESIGRVHYVLRWFHDGHNEEFAFPGEAFHPIAQSPDGPIEFELVAHRTSTTMLLDVFTKKLLRISPTAPERAGVPYRPLDSGRFKQLISPDRHWLVSTKWSGGSQQIWLKRTTGGPAIQLTGGNCNSFSPSWDLNSSAVIFASDCDRGIGLPALYRARLDKFQGQ
ncbi:MAG: DUF2029 domain-containing protein [Acidobacteriaceae bacterium]|nr:DUF2029 domain-containing protein [Acidobacteriaceae bacterium]